MPRTSRAAAPDYPHHITQRGNNREAVFFDDQDRQTYLDFLRHYLYQHQLDLWAYCLMPNHIHLLVVPHVSEDLARGIGLTNQSYTRYINRKYLRSGRIWQNRFYSCIVDTDDHHWTVARYIESNPVKAGITSNAFDYRWSSARHHLEDDDSDPLLHKSAWLADDDRETYRALLLSSNDSRDKEIQQATRGGRPFCSAKTLTHLEKFMGRNFC